MTKLKFRMAILGAVTAVTAPVVTVLILCKKDKEEKPAAVVLPPGVTNVTGAKKNYLTEALRASGIQVHDDAIGDIHFNDGFKYEENGAYEEAFAAIHFNIIEDISFIDTASEDAPDGFVSLGEDHGITIAATGPTGNEMSEIKIIYRKDGHDVSVANEHAQPILAKLFGIVHPEWWTDGGDGTHAILPADDMIITHTWSDDTEVNIAAHVSHMPTNLTDKQIRKIVASINEMPAADVAKLTNIELLVSKIDLTDPTINTTYKFSATVAANDANNFVKVKQAFSSVTGTVVDPIEEDEVEVPEIMIEEYVQWIQTQALHSSLTSTQLSTLINGPKTGMSMEDLGITNELPGKDVITATFESAGAWAGTGLIPLKMHVHYALEDKTIDKVVDVKLAHDVNVTQAQMNNWKIPLTRVSNFTKEQLESVLKAAPYQVEDADDYNITYPMERAHWRLGLAPIETFADAPVGVQEKLDFIVHYAVDPQNTQYPTGWDSNGKLHLKMTVKAIHSTDNAKVVKNIVVTPAAVIDATDAWKEESVQEMTELNNMTFMTIDEAADHFKRIYSIKDHVYGFAHNKAYNYNHLSPKELDGILGINSDWYSAGQAYLATLGLEMIYSMPEITLDQPNLKWPIPIRARIISKKGTQVKCDKKDFVYKFRGRYAHWFDETVI